MRSKENSTTIFFVRHGQTDFPHDRIYCDCVEDPPLNQKGIIQAKKTALFFEGRKIDAIFSSPTQRTITTAKEIADVISQPIQLESKLMERRFGVWEGKYFKEIEVEFPVDYQAWKADQVGFTPSGGETLADVNLRVSSALGSIIQRHINGMVIIVSHVGPIRACVCSAFDIPLSQFRQLNVDNASITQIAYGETKNNLVKLNFY